MISVNPCITCMMIGEKSADLLMRAEAGSKVASTAASSLLYMTRKSQPDQRPQNELRDNAGITLLLKVRLSHDRHYRPALVELPPCASAGTRGIRRGLSR